MSWQGNECFVFCIEYVHDDWHGRMLDAMDELLWLYGEHGNGWYLMGSFDQFNEEEDFDEPDWGKGFECTWLPNPFMAPDVMAVNVRGPHDLMKAAVECCDCHCDVIAYAGDGDEPLERVTVYGETYDMRAA